MSLSEGEGNTSYKVGEGNTDARNLFFVFEFRQRTPNSFYARGSNVGGAKNIFTSIRLVEKRMHKLLKLCTCGKNLNKSH